MNNELTARVFQPLPVHWVAVAETWRTRKACSTTGMVASAWPSLLSTTVWDGPTIASYIPRCMAGTLLLHVGVDLFLEGVYDTIGKFDSLEYAGIWLITIVMTLWGMKDAMIAGFITAISTYAVQNLTYVHPLRGAMAATTLRSSRWNRSARAQTILADHGIGRSRILVVQLQGHLFLTWRSFTDRIVCCRSG
jgi:MFS superfamily sulfate permease-like transporter